MDFSGLIGRGWDADRRREYRGFRTWDVKLHAHYEAERDIEHRERYCMQQEDKRSRRVRRATPSPKRRKCDSTPPKAKTVDPLEALIE